MWALEQWQMVSPITFFFAFVYHLSGGKDALWEEVKPVEGDLGSFVWAINMQINLMFYQPKCCCRPNTLQGNGSGHFLLYSAKYCSGVIQGT